MNVDAIFSALGRFSVRFRWIMALTWIIGAMAAHALLPSLSSVTQSDNTKFLPASAPVEKATMLAKPFGTSNLLPIPLIAARQNGQLTSADSAALTSLQAKLKADPSVVRIIDLGQSVTGQSGPAGQGSEFVVLVHQLGGDPNAGLDLVNGLRKVIHQTPRPAGLQVHLAGSIAVQVDQQKASGNQGNQLQLYVPLLIIVLLVLIFRSLTLALVTLVPAFLSVAISGPLVAEAAQHGLKVSPIAQFLLIVLVLGAGTDYGLFLVFRAREQLRLAGHDGGPGSSIWADLRRPREPARQAIITSITRVGESITFSRCHAAGGADSAAGAALRQVVAARGQAHAVPADVRAAEAAAMGHPGQQQGRLLGHDLRADRQAPDPDAARRPGLLRRPRDRRDRLQGGRLRRQHRRAGGHRLGRWPGAADEVLPAGVVEPDQPDLQV